MWRAMMMALGLSLTLLGGEAMVVDRFILADASSDATSPETPYPSLSPSVRSPYTPYDAMPAYGGAAFPAKPPNRRVFVPPEWAPWGLLSAGALTFLYATALPKKS